jgi:hypothetical protein
MANIRLFEHSNIAGRQLFITSPSSQRYVLATSQFLNEFEFDDITSSVRLSANPKDPYHTCILFENDRFDGKFKAFSFNNIRNIISLPYFNDLTSSVILVTHDQTSRVTMVGLRQLAGTRINEAVDQQLKNFREISRNGEVILKFSIDAFEIGQFGKDLVKIEIPLEIQTPFPYRNYQVKLGYYIDLFITDQDILKANVAGASYWIMPGVLSGAIEKRLKIHSMNTARLIDSELNNLLHEFNWHQWKDIYLLPGLTDRFDKDYEGNVEDDCTLVLVQENPAS